MTDWYIWATGIALLLLAGAVATVRFRRAARHSSLTAEIARARRAIALAEAARDGCAAADPEAQLRLDQAFSLLSGVRDPVSAVHAQELAAQAEARWRAAAQPSGTET